MSAEEYIVYVSWVRFMFCHLGVSLWLFHGRTERIHLRHKVKRCEESGGM